MFDIDYAATLDRAALGSMAIPDEVLNILNFVSMESVYGESNTAELTKLYTKMSEILDKYGIDMVTAQGELFYWWMRSDDERKRERAQNGGQRAWEATLKLSFYINADEVTRSFYAYGIWDKKFINKCVKQGIDPSLAVHVKAA